MARYSQEYVDTLVSRIKSPREAYKSHVDRCYYQAKRHFAAARGVMERSNWSMERKLASREESIQAGFLAWASRPVWPASAE